MFPKTEANAKRGLKPGQNQAKKTRKEYTCRKRGNLPERRKPAGNLPEADRNLTGIWYFSGIWHLLRNLTSFSSGIWHFSSGISISRPESALVRGIKKDLPGEPFSSFLRRFAELVYPPCTLRVHPSMYPSVYTLVTTGLVFPNARSCTIRHLER